VFVSSFSRFKASIWCFMSIMSAFDSIPAQRQGNKASGSFASFARRSLASLRARSSAFLKTLHPRRIGLPFDAMQKSLLVQEEIAREHTLTVKLFK